MEINFFLSKIHGRLSRLVSADVYNKSDMCEIFKNKNDNIHKNEVQAIR